MCSNAPEPLPGRRRYGLGLLAMRLTQESCATTTKKAIHPPTYNSPMASASHARIRVREIRLDGRKNEKMARKMANGPVTRVRGKIKSGSNAVESAALS